jgi:hypothetical protein
MERKREWSSTGRPRGAVITQKRPGAKTGALVDRSREPKPEADFPATTLHRQLGMGMALQG